MSNDLDDFAKDLLAAAMDLQTGKYAKQFLRKEGSKLRKKTVNKAKSKVNKRSGNLFKAIKRGKVYKYDGDLAVRVHGGKHTHLINNGHRIVDKNGNEHGFKEGIHFFESAEEDFGDEYEKDCLELIDDLLDNHDL